MPLKPLKLRPVRWPMPQPGRSHDDGMRRPTARRYTQRELEDQHDRETGGSRPWGDPGSDTGKVVRPIQEEWSIQA